MTNSRRKFLRNSSIAATGLIIATPSGAKDAKTRRTAIVCAPESITQLSGTVASVKSGSWSDTSTWGGRIPQAGDTPVIASGHTVTYNVNETTVAGVNINAGGTLEFDANKTTTLISSRNIVVQGRLVMKPSSARFVQTIRFIGIDENKVKGSTHDVLESDIGLWVMGAGRLDISGARKKSWTNLTGSAGPGTTTITVKDATNWAVGDEIFIVPTEMPDEHCWGYDNNKQEVIDHFGPKFENRIISAISGNNITLDKPLQHRHDAVVADSGKMWTAEVGNISRNVNVEGTEKGRTHMFVRSTSPQSIYYLRGKHLGPRRKQSNSAKTMLVTGRYGLHFHHCMFGSVGSIVEGCVLTDLGNRAFVPHVSHGVTLNNNIVYRGMEASFWWDFQDVSHDCVFDGNLTAYMRWNGIDNGFRGMEMNMGDGNIARNNVVVFAHAKNPHHQGAYVWNADTEGVWIFENNLSHSNRTGIFVWQNTGNNHTIVNFESYNDFVGIFHGAYINSYTYTGGYLYNALLTVKATSGNASGVRFEKMTFDGANKLPFVAELFPSPVTSGADYNAFRECTFKNYKDVALSVNTFLLSDENARKHGSLIKCNFTGKMVGFTKASLYNSKVYIQPATGNCSLVTQSGTSRIEPFAPYYYGTGRGLKGEYFNGGNFEQKAFTRLDSMIMFQQWVVDKKFAPFGVHHKITTDRYSMRWTGFVEAQYSEPYKFKTTGGGGFRLWINDELVINDWKERHKVTDAAITKPIQMEAGKKYAIRLEHNNLSGTRGFQFYWECPSMKRFVHVPQSQLYSDGNFDNRPPIVNQNPVAVAGEDVEITLPVNTVVLDGSQSDDPDGKISSFNWSMIKGPSAYAIAASNQAKTSAKDLVEGVYTFRLRVTDDKGAVHEDDKIVTVKKGTAKPVSNAGADIVITLPQNKVTLDGSASAADAKVKSYTWSKVSGPEKLKIVKANAIKTDVEQLVEGVYVFKLLVRDQKDQTHEDEVVVTVNAATPGNKSPISNAGKDVTITLPVSEVTLDGSASTDPDGKIVTYKWLMVSGPVGSTFSNQNNVITKVQKLTAGEYTFRLLVTDDKGAIHNADVKVTVHASRQENSKPVANAGADIRIELPVNKTTLNGSGTDGDGKVTGYKWSLVSGPSKFRIVKANAPVSQLEDLVEGTYVFRLTVTDDKGATGSDDVTVTVAKNGSGTPSNQAPNAQAGDDVTITFPINKTVVDGSRSSDPNGHIVAYNWYRLSGPHTATIVSANKAVTEIRDFVVAGVYVFRLFVTNNRGITDIDDVTIVVNNSGTQTQRPDQNQKPGTGLQVYAGDDQSVQLPTNSTVLSGLVTGGNPVSYRWIKTSGPSRFKLVSPDKLTTQLQDLGPGVYKFRLTVTDDRKQTASHDMVVTVAHSIARVEQPTSLNAAVYPNPAQVEFNVTLRSNTNTPITLRVHNQWGQVLKAMTAENNSTVAFGRELKTGQYFLIAEQGVQKKIIKLIKL